MRRVLLCAAIILLCVGMFCLGVGYEQTQQEQSEYWIINYPPKNNDGTWNSYVRNGKECDFILEVSRPDGTWDEIPAFVG